MAELETRSGTARKVVARFADGRLVKGYTFDFHPSRPRFQVFATPAASGSSTLVLVRELKALFFVRDLVGDPGRHDRKGFLAGQIPSGRPVEVVFKDGEVLVGTAADSPDEEAPGFFVVPADPASNNLRVYVARGAIRGVHPVVLSRAASPPALGTSRRPAPGGALLSRRLLAWLAR